MTTGDATDTMSGTAAARRLAAARLAEFRVLRERGALCADVSEQIAAEATGLLMSEYAASGAYLADAVTLLAEMATLEAPCAADPGQKPVFPPLVERLSDSFDPTLCGLYDRAFAQMVAVARRLPAAAQIDASLRSFHLISDDALLLRKAELGRRGPWLAAEEHRRVRKVLVLSRVTLGADVAITSVVLQKAQALFPNARRVLLAPAKAEALFGGDATLAIRAAPYPGGGTLIERLASWAAVLASVDAEFQGLPPEECVVLDPDSRYLQLGLLPVLGDESRYFFFESRRAGGDGPANLSRLTNDWLDSTFGATARASPRVALRKADQDSGRELRQRLTARGATRLIAVSFGVGGNNEKRLTDSFEGQLVARLIEDGAAVVLDEGAGEEEAERARRAVSVARERGGKVAHFDAASPSAMPAECRLVTWQGSIGAWAGVIAASDEYIGYDSAGQHLAAALGIPAIDIFTSISTPRFRQRWRPADTARVLTADAAAPDMFLEEVLAAHHEIIRSGAG